MRLLDDDIDLLKHSDLEGFPTGFDLLEWFERNNAKFERLEKAEAGEPGIADPDNETDALKLWREMQAFYMGIKYNNGDMIAFRRFVDAYKDTLLFNIPEEHKIIGDIRYVKTPKEVDAVIDTLENLCKDRGKTVTENATPEVTIYKSPVEDVYPIPEEKMAINLINLILARCQDGETVCTEDIPEKWQHDCQETVDIIKDSDNFNRILDGILKKIGENPNGFFWYVSLPEAVVISRILGGYNPDILMPALTEPPGAEKNRFLQFKMFPIPLFNEVEKKRALPDIPYHEQFGLKAGDLSQNLNKFLDYL